jgi:hypothetical protein
LPVDSYGYRLRVCVFTPDDVDDMIEADETDPPADFNSADWLSQWRNKVEDRMSEQGNETIGIFLSMDGVV